MTEMVRAADGCSSLQVLADKYVSPEIVCVAVQLPGQRGWYADQAEMPTLDVEPHDSCKLQNLSGLCQLTASVLDLSCVTDMRLSGCLWRIPISPLMV